MSTMDGDSSRSTEVAIAHGAWAAAIAGIEAFCGRVIEAALRAAAPALAGRAEISILLTDDAQGRELNRVWRGQAHATNVLSFPITHEPWSDAAAGQPVALGDIVLAFETVKREATEAGIPLADHVAHLLVHGTLHLLGHDHLQPSEAERMERLEVEILAGLGIPDPYRGELAA
jgi:probable rRNA maturation factor